MIALDVVVGPSRPIILILAALFVTIVLAEGGILALMGLRPVGKAFTNTFLSNIAAAGAGFLVWMMADVLGLQEVLMLITVLVAATAVQGLVLSAQRQNMTKARTWAATLAMKGCSLILMIAFIKVIDL